MRYDIKQTADEQNNNARTSYHTGASIYKDPRRELTITSPPRTTLDAFSVP